jgi:hypothetical protein
MIKSYFPVYHWIALSIWALLAIVPSTIAQQNADYTSQVQPFFGQKLTFTLSGSPSDAVQQVQLVLRLPSESVLVLERVPFTENNRHFSAQVDVEISKLKLLPFAVVEYYWQIQYLTGGTENTPPLPYRYVDDRFAWQTVERQQVRVHWYAGDLAYAERVAQLSERVITEGRTAYGLSELAVIDLYLYPRQSELLSGWVDAPQWVAGHALPSQNIARLVIPPGSGDNLVMGDLVPHELAHWLVYQVPPVGYRDLPVWLNEGLAMLAQNQVSTQLLGALQTAAEQNQLLSFEDLCGYFPQDEPLVQLAYAQSYSFVRYLAETYGREKLLNLLVAYKNGVRCTAGVQQIYQKDFAVLQADWHRSLVPKNFFLASLTSPYFWLALLLLALPLLLWARVSHR